MSKRMSKDARRDQLLSVAKDIIKNDGTDALTLKTLADKAGVTKPLTYTHFSTRQNLLIQIYKQCDEQIIATMNESIECQPRTMTHAAKVAACAYVDCVCRCGALYEAVIAALQAYPEHKHIRTQIRDYFVNAYHKIFQPVVSLSGDALQIKLIAVFGTTEEIGRAVISGDVNRDHVTDVLADIIAAILK